MNEHAPKRPNWSARTRWDLAETPWAQQLSALRAAGTELFDLTVSNPTRCGFVYDEAAILEPLHDTRALLYDPDPKGMLTARLAVSDYYREHAAGVDAEHIVLTASTSEAYSFLFRLLCDPGEEVLIAQPGYPLVDFLATLDDVRLVPYPLFYDHGWHLDLETLRRCITPRTRAIVIVHPNNPTGHFTSRQDREAIEILCRVHGMALIVDEVFLDYGLAGPGASFAIGDHPVPTFVLSGLSKVAALPQMKIAWIACFTQPDALQRLEIVADTFLSVSVPVQCALPAWLRQGEGMQSQIHRRVAANLSALDQMLRHQSLVSRLIVEAGWYAILRIPYLQSAEDLAIALLVEQHVVLHASGFFGFVDQGNVVVSLLGPEREFQEGVRLLCSRFVECA